MNTSRRAFIKKGVLAGALGSIFASGCMSGGRSPKGGVKVGYMAPKTDKPDHFEYARIVGFDGVEMSSSYKDGKFKVYTTPSIMKEMKAAADAEGIPVCSIAATEFNNHSFVYDPKTMDALKQCIDACAFFGAKDILVPFFVHTRLNDEDGQPINEKHFAPLVKNLKEIAPYAEKNGIYLCLENTLSAKDNIRIIDAAGSPNVRMYYDTANAHRYGYNVPTEIRQLGLKYMKRIHFKDNVGRFNSMNPDTDAAVAACKDIGYKDWVVLERNFETATPMAYWRHNIDYVKKAFGA